MAFDPSIISQIPDFAPNPAKAKEEGYKLADLADNNTLNKMKLTDIKQQQEEEQKYKQVLKGRDWSTDKGATETAEALTQAGLPNKAMQFIKERQGIQSGALDIQKQKIDIALIQQESIAGAMDAVHRQVEDYKQANPNATPAMLSAKTQELIVPAMDQLEKQDPQLAPAIERYKQSPGALTYDGLTAAMAVSKSGLARLKEHRDEMKSDRDERAQNTRDLDQITRSKAEERKQATEDFKEAQTKKKEEENKNASDATADLIGTYRLRPPTGLGSRSPESRELMEKVAKKYPDYDATKYDEKRTAMVAFGTGKQGQTVLALNNAISHMDTLSDLTKALDNGDLKQFNRIANLWASETGGEAPGDFDAAKHIVAEEVSKAVLPGGGGVQERLEVAANAGNAKSPAALAGVIRTWKKLLSGQMVNMKQQYKRTTGLDNFDEAMSPAALKELQVEGRGPVAAVDNLNEAAAPGGGAAAPPTAPVFDPNQPGVGFWKKK